MRFSGWCWCSNSLRHQVPNYTYWSHQATAECHCCVRHIIQLVTRPPRYRNIVMLTRHGHTGHPPGGHQHCQHCHGHGQHLANTTNTATETNITKVNKHHHNRKDGSVWRMVLLWPRSMSILWSCFYKLFIYMAMNEQDENWGRNYLNYLNMKIRLSTAESGGNLL